MLAYHCNKTFCCIFFKNNIYFYDKLYLLICDVFLQKLQTIVKDLQEIDKLRPKVADIQVPLEVFDYIDQGRNPQLYTKDCMEKAVAKNEEVKGKIDAYRLFKAKLLEELTRVFPKETGCYRAMRGDS